MSICVCADKKKEKHNKFKNKKNKTKRLNELPIFKTPQDKLDSVVEVSDLVCVCVDEYKQSHKKLEPDTPKKKGDLGTMM